MFPTLIPLGLVEAMRGEIGADRYVDLTTKEFMLDGLNLLSALVLKLERALVSP